LPDPVSILSRSWLEPKNPSNSASQTALRAHPYYITHASDNATIPRSSETLNNWQVDGLNNFRQNTQGNLGQLNVADLTVELADLESLCELQGGMADLSAEVCNRGTNPVQDGVIVEFLETTDPNAPVGGRRRRLPGRHHQAAAPRRMRDHPVQRRAQGRRQYLRGRGPRG
jgi:hypothetical protein